MYHTGLCFRTLEIVARWIIVQPTRSFSLFWVEQINDLEKYTKMNVPDWPQSPSSTNHSYLILKILHFLLIFIVNHIGVIKGVC